MLQGASKITYMKEHHLEGLVLMRLRMLSAYMERISKLTIWDVFCGSGENVIDGELIDGSPLAIMDALQGACRKCFRLHSHKVELCLSDIRPEAVTSAVAILDDKYSHRPDLFTHNSYASLVTHSAGTASERLEEAHQRLIDHPSERAIIYADPNGTATFPYPQLMGMLAEPRLKNRVDVIANISATALKRMNASRIAQVNVQDWIGRFENIFVNAVPANGGSAWVRQPVAGDPWQWTMLAYWCHPIPQWEWPKAGFVRIDSAKGRAAVDTYSTTRKAS